MIANYGYQDGSGTYFITVDTEKCDGCGKCVHACLYEVLEMVPDEFDPLTDGMVVSVVGEHRNRLKYSCASCKSSDDKKDLPCILACSQEALKHF
jgi:Fe-S-cluster-containing hydrogenase component 2